MGTIVDYAQTKCWCGKAHWCDHITQWMSTWSGSVIDDGVGEWRGSSAPVVAVPLVPTVGLWVDVQLAFKGVHGDTAVVTVADADVDKGLRTVDTFLGVIGVSDSLSTLRAMVSEWFMTHSVLPAENPDCSSFMHGFKEQMLFDSTMKLATGPAFPPKVLEMLWNLTWLGMCTMCADRPEDDFSDLAPASQPTHKWNPGGQIGRR